MNIPAILNYLRPGEEWALSGNTYDGLEWFSSTPKPTETELEAAWPTVQTELQAKEIDAKRRHAYANEADPLFFKWQRNESTEQAWLDKVAEIKVRFPDLA